jgi:hypothetical protein
VSDNNKCISLRGYDWLERFLDENGSLVKQFHCDGTNTTTTAAATNTVMDDAGNDARK